MNVDVSLPKLILTDENRLSQVLINLISNAIKFTAKGSVEIKVQYTPDHDSIPEDLKNEKNFHLQLDNGVVHKLTTSNENKKENENEGESNSDFSNSLE